MDSFRHGGGIPYHEMGHDVPCSIERFFEPAYRHFMVSQWFAAIPALVPKLKAGEQVADIGCGRGQSTVHMAKSFPKSSFVGVDYHRDSIASAMKLADENAATNVTFI
jgi:tRNA G46 methylase TrmB